MPAIFVSGDLFEHPELPALAHGCNCAGAMGAGIAKEFRRRFPAMYEAYKTQCHDGTFRLGGVFRWQVPSGLMVYNLGTQTSWKTPADIIAIETAVRSAVIHARLDGILQIGMPLIGTGLGGLPPDPVKAVLQLIGRQTDVDLVVFECYVPGQRAYLIGSA